MRAFILTRYGGPEAAELRDVAVPGLGPGEVQIAVKAAGLNPVDFKIREGKLRVINSYALPTILDCELSGVVTSVGAGVTRFHPGDEVFTRVAKDRLGAFAETACVHEGLVAKKPQSLAALIDAKQLEVIVDKLLPFAEIRQACEDPERGHAKGKVVVTM